MKDNHGNVAQLLGGEDGHVSRVKGLPDGVAGCPMLIKYAERCSNRKVVEAISVDVSLPFMHNSGAFCRKGVDLEQHSSPLLEEVKELFGCEAGGFGEAEGSAAIGRLGASRECAVLSIVVACEGKPMSV